MDKNKITLETMMEDHPCIKQQIERQQGNPSKTTKVCA
jgi:hypothetical protein